MTTSVIATFLLFATLAQARAFHQTHSRGYLAAVKLNHALAGTPMRGTGFALVVEAKRWNIHPALIAGIAGAESSYGAAACRGNPFNAFGLSSCGSGWYVPVFRSWREAYRFVARFLHEHWPTARSPWDLHGYAACDACWSAHVAREMQSLGFAAVARWR